MHVSPANVTPVSESGRMNKLVRLLGQPLVWGLLSMVLFYIFRAPWVYPGESAELMAQTVGVVPSSGMVLHPLVQLIANALAGCVPASCVVGAFNLLAVVAGGLSVWLLCAIVKGFLRASMREKHTVPHLSLATALAVPMAALALLMAPSFFLASTHFQWQQIDLLLLLCAAFLVVRVLCHETKGRFVVAALTIGLVSAGAVSSLLVMPLLCFGLIVAHHVQSQHPTLRHLAFAMFLPMGVGALLTCLAAAALQPGEETSLFLRMATYVKTQGLALYAQSIYEQWIVFALLGIFPGVLATVLASVVGRNLRSFPILVIYLTIGVFATLTFLPLQMAPFHIAGTWEEVYPVTVDVLTAFAMAITCGTGALLIRVKRTAEGESETVALRQWSGYCGWLALVVAPLLMLGFGSVRLCGVLGADAEARDLPRVTADRILAATQGKETWLLADGVLDPYLALRIAETDAPITLLSLPQEQQDKAYVKARLLELLETSPHLQACFEGNPGLKQTLKYAVGDIGGLRPFLQDWLRHDPEAVEVFMPLVLSELWLAGNRYPVPEGFWYRGVPTYAEQLAALPVTQWEAVPETSEQMSYAGQAFVKHLRRHLGQLAVESARNLMVTERKHDAYACFRTAYDYDPTNTSALIGAYIFLKNGTLDPVKPEGEGEALAAYEAECARLDAEEAKCLKAIKAHPKLSQRYKDMLADPKSHFLTANALEQLLLSWTNAGQDPTALFEDETLISAAQQNVWGHQARFYEQVPGRRRESIGAYQKHLATVTTPEEEIVCLLKLMHLNLLEGKTAEAKVFLEQAAEVAQQLDQQLYAEYLKLSEQERQKVPAPKVSYYLDYDYAVYYIAIGELAKARTSLQTFLTRQPGNLDALALLATLQLQAGEIKQVRDITMKQLLQAAKTADTYQIKILQAQLAEADKDFKAARKAYLRAYVLNPQAHLLRDAILRLDMMLLDADAAREHARDFLVRDREHPLSNYVMGSLALQENDLDRALFYLQLATAATVENPPPEAFNDLSETYRRRGRWADALAMAKQAYERSPGLPIAHETAAAALLELGRYEEAHRELDTALAVEQQVRPNELADPRIAITRARLYVKEGKVDEARRELIEARKQYRMLDAASKQDFDTLAQQLNLHF